MRFARERAGVSQKQLAAELGMNSSIISKTEKGDQLPSALLVCEYARAFDVTTDFLLLGAPFEPERSRAGHSRAGGKADGSRRTLVKSAAAPARAAAPPARLVPARPLPKARPAKAAATLPTRAGPSTRSAAPTRVGVPARSGRAGQKGQPGPAGPSRPPTRPAPSGRPGQPGRGRGREPR